jgi:hypothetical protein
MDKNGVAEEQGFEPEECSFLFVYVVEISIWFETHSNIDQLRYGGQMGDILSIHPFPQLFPSFKKHNPLGFNSNTLPSLRIPPLTTTTLFQSETTKSP